MLSIGIFIVPFAVLALNLLTRRGSPGAEALGAVTGAGLVGVVVWPLNRDYRPCPEGPISGEFECGGFDATPWLVVGLALAAMGVTA